MFLEYSFDGASINEMNRRSGISKETFYRYFKSKEELFLAVVEYEHEIYDNRFSILNEVDDTAPMYDMLLGLAVGIVTFITSKRTMALRRVITNECSNHPQLGKLYWSNGPQRSYNVLKHCFKDLEKKGVKWRIEPGRLAEYFMALLMYKPTLEQQFCIKKRPSKAQVRKIAKTAVDDFLECYLIK